MKFLKPRIETISEKKLIGKHIKMSFAEDKTVELWRSFMPCRREIENFIGSDLYSIMQCEPGFFENFKTNVLFKKWVAIEVSTFDKVPPEMYTLTLPRGEYAVFIHKGLVSEADKTYNYIFGTWIPNSNFVLDNRPHFTVMGEKYKNNDPDSEEEIWIPVNPKMLN